MKVHVRACLGGPPPFVLPSKFISHKKWCAFWNYSKRLHHWHAFIHSAQRGHFWASMSGPHQPRGACEISAWQQISLGSAAKGSALTVVFSSCRHLQGACYLEWRLQGKKGISTSDTLQGTSAYFQKKNTRDVIFFRKHKKSKHSAAFSDSGHGLAKTMTSKDRYFSWKGGIFFVQKTSNFWRWPVKIIWKNRGGLLIFSSKNSENFFKKLDQRMPNSFQALRSLGILMFWDPLCCMISANTFFFQPTRYP